LKILYVYKLSKTIKNKNDRKYYQSIIAHATTFLTNLKLRITEIITSEDDGNRSLTKKNTESV